MSIEFTADRTSITAGECVNLTWNVGGGGVDRIEISAVAAPLAGSYQDCPTSNTSYYLDALDANGNSLGHKMVSVTVKPKVSPISIDFRVDRERIYQGECVNFSWKVSGPNIGRLEINDTFIPAEYQWPLCPQENTTLTLSAWDKNDNFIDSKSITVYVDPPPAALVINFTANPMQIKRGETTELNWYVSGEGADHVVINGVKTSLTGKFDYRPETEYSGFLLKLEVKDSNGKTIGTKELIVSISD